MPKIFESPRDNLTISTDPRRLDLDVICDLLSRAYWAQGRSRPRTERAIQNSLVFGIYDGDLQIGLARLVTDYAIFAYLCDVCILEAYRGQGIGKWLISTILTHPDLQDLRRCMLATRDAHDLYRRFGFETIKEPENWMESYEPAYAVS